MRVYVKQVNKDHKFAYFPRKISDIIKVLQQIYDLDEGRMYDVLKYCKSIRNDLKTKKKYEDNKNELTDFDDIF